MPPFLTRNERLTLGISATALLASVVTLYFQFFFVKQGAVAGLGFAAVHDSIRLELSIINSGTRELLFTRIQLALRQAAGMELGFEPSLQPQLPFVVQPARIQPVHVTVPFSSDQYYWAAAEPDSCFRYSTLSLRKVVFRLHLSFVTTQGEQHDWDNDVMTAHISRHNGASYWALIGESVDLFDAHGVHHWRHPSVLPCPFPPPSRTTSFHKHGEPGAARQALEGHGSEF
jgi:hypothetical protein